MRHDVTNIINDLVPVTQMTKRQSLSHSAQLNDNALHAKRVRRQLECRFMGCRSEINRIAY